MSDIVGGKLCSKTGGGNLETATKNQRKMAPESRLNQHEKVWRAPAFAEQIRPEQNSEWQSWRGLVFKDGRGESGNRDEKSTKNGTRKSS